MGKRPTNWRLWSKVAIAGLVAGIGGPMFTAWITPTEDEIRAKYNPDLRRRSLEQRAQREKEFDEFVTQLKAYSKSDKPIWVVAKEHEEAKRREALESAKARDQEAAARKDEMKRQASLGGNTDTTTAAGADGQGQRGWLGWLGWK